jgi:hypothetical protein
VQAFLWFTVSTPWPTRAQSGAACLVDSRPSSAVPALACSSCPAHPPRPACSPPAGFIPFEFASYTRWSWALQPAWYAAGPLKKGTHTLFRPIKAAAWGLFGLIFPLQTSTPGGRPHQLTLLPTHISRLPTAGVPVCTKRAASPWPAASPPGIPALPALAPGRAAEAPPRPAARHLRHDWHR